MMFLNRIFSLREIVSLVAATALPTLLLATLAMLEGNAGEVVWIVELGFIFSFGFSVILAVPTIIILNILKVYNLIAYLLSGLLFGILILGYMSYPDIFRFGLTDFLQGLPAREGQLIVIWLLTSISALFYWLVARPDRIHGPARTLDSHEEGGAGLTG